MSLFKSLLPFNELKCDSCKYICMIDPKENLEEYMEKYGIKKSCKNAGERHHTFLADVKVLNYFISCPQCKKSDGIYCGYGYDK